MRRKREWWLLRDEANTTRVNTQRLGKLANRRTDAQANVILALFRTHRQTNTLAHRRTRFNAMQNCVRLSPHDCLLLNRMR